MIESICKVQLDSVDNAIARVGMAHSIEESRESASKLHDFWVKVGLGELVD